MQEGVVIDYTAVGDGDIAAHLENATFTEQLANNINEAGETLDDIAPEDVTSQTVSVQTDVTFEGDALHLAFSSAISLCVHKFLVLKRFACVRCCTALA